MQAFGESSDSSGGHKCELLIAAGERCGRRFRSSAALGAHVQRSAEGGEHGYGIPVHQAVVSNELLWCRGRFSSVRRARGCQVVGGLSGLGGQGFAGAQPSALQRGQGGGHARNDAHPRPGLWVVGVVRGLSGIGGRMLVGVSSWGSPAGPRHRRLGIPLGREGTSDDGPLRWLDLVIHHPPHIAMGMPELRRASGQEPAPAKFRIRSFLGRQHCDPGELRSFVRSHLARWACARLGHAVVRRALAYELMILA